MNILGLNISVDRNPTAKIRWTRRALVLGSANALVLGGGVAMAAWSVSGSGVGTAAAGTATPLAITAGVAPTSLLVPGGTGDVRMVITNNNKANVSLTALTMTNTGIAGFTDNTFGTAKPLCTTTGVTWTTTSKTLTTPIVIAPNGGTYTLTLTGLAQMSTASDDGCQSAVFNMPVTAVTAVVTATAASSPTSGSQS
jgi:hypothetical protein